MLVKEGATEEIVGSNPTSGTKITQEEVISHMYYDYEEQRNSKMDGKLNIRLPLLAETAAVMTLWL